MTHGRLKCWRRTSLVTEGCSWQWTSLCAAFLTCQGEDHTHAADTDGAMLTKARADKEEVYTELATSGRCKLIVMAMETGGRWSEESVAVLRELTHAKAQEAPSFKRFSVGLMWERRWTRILAVTCATAFAASLVEPARHISWCHTGWKTLFWLICLSQTPDSFVRDSP